MKESLRGYATAVIDRLDAAQTQQLAEELATFLHAFDQDDLSTALTDPSLPARARRLIVEDLLESRASQATTSLVSYAVGNERPSELASSLEWLARKVGDAERPDMGTHESLSGRLATRERLDGYSTAVFEQIADRSHLEEVEDELFRLARTVEASDALRPVLSDMDIPASLRRGIVEDLLRPVAQPATVRLAGYATRAGRARDFVPLLDWLVERTAYERNLRIAEVRSAVDLDEEQRERLGAVLAARTGKPVELRVTVDPDLIGGVVALVGDTIIDGSIQHRLDQLRASMTSAFSADQPTKDQS